LKYDFTASIGRDIKGLKIAVIKELINDSTEIDVKNAVAAAVEMLQSQGAEVSEVSMPILEYSAPAYFALSSAEAVSALSRFDGVKYGLRGNGASHDEQIRDSRTRGFGDEVKRRIMLGNFVLSGDNIETYFRKALAIKQQISFEFDSLFKKFDAAIFPTSMRTAFSIDEPSDFVKIYSSTLYTVPANLAGLPCVSTPIKISYVQSGKTAAPVCLPVGLSITGKKFGEATILQIADCIEQMSKGVEV
jgi:aspartyl-tRNA(Asn)/glutamyl-tRNA(Gln) amidotransferase subunit A